MRRLMLLALIQVCIPAYSAGGPPGSAQVVGPRATEASRVRILMVIDTNGDTSGIGIALNERILTDALRDSFHRQGLVGRYTLDVLRGDKATPERVLNHYRNLKTD